VLSQRGESQRDYEGKKSGDKKEITGSPTTALGNLSVMERKAL
jgi:hypothetical protein